MNDNQIINLNLGLNWTEGSKSGEFKYSDAIWMLGMKFNFSLIEHEGYMSTWNDGQRTYEDNCIAVRITVPIGRDYEKADILEKVNSVRILLKQQAAAIDVWESNGMRFSSVYYGNNPPADALQFDPNYFHYMS